MTTKYRTPEAKAWVKIAERFDAGKEPSGLCYAASKALAPERVTYFGAERTNPIKRFEPDEFATDTGHYWPTRCYGRHTPKHDEYRVYAALLIAAMCDTGDAYP